MQLTPSEIVILHGRSFASVKRPWGMVGLALIFVLAGLLLMATGAHSTWNGIASLSWPTANGQIESSELIKRDDMYTPSVQYTYEVDGFTLASSIISFSGNWSSSEKLDIESIVERYPTNARVDVYYDPTDPTVSVLEPGLKIGMIAVVLSGLFFAAAGVYLFVCQLPLLGRH